MKTVLEFLLLALVLSTQLPATAQGKHSVTIGIVADVQYAQGVPDRIGRHYSTSNERLKEAVRHFNQIGDLEFVIDLGDMTDCDYTHYATLQDVKRCLHTQWHNVMGNHDLKGVKDAGDLTQAADMKSLRKPYYSVTRGGVRFIFLNTSDIATHSSLPNTPAYRLAETWLADCKAMKAPFAKDYNGGIGLKQLVWLENELKKADAKNQTAIICCHMVLFPFDTAESLWNGMEVVHLIERHPSVKAVFCGHRHSGGYFERKGIHYVNFKGMVEGNNNRFAVVTIEPASHSIVIDGIGDEPDRTLECR